MGQRPVTTAALCSLFLIALAGTGCPDQARPAPDVIRSKLDTGPNIVVKAGAGQFFSFFNMRAEMQTVEQILDVVETARSDVMITDPQVQLQGDLVIVADLRKKNSAGIYRSWVEPKSKWLDRVVPKTSKLTVALVPKAQPAVKKRRPRRRRRRRRRPRRRPVAKPSPTPTAAAPTPATKVRVILFSTAWCPSCKTARRFFQRKGVPFRELDVEKDQQAQQQYIALQRTYKLRQGVVPLIIVNGRIFQGFSQPQVEAALAAGPPKG